MGGDKLQAPDREYLDTLCLYYEEEVEGEAYFLEIAARLTEPDHRRKMQLMAEVETCAAAAVRPLLDKYGLNPRPRALLLEQGRAQAADVTTDWATLVGDMRKSFPAYMDDFHRLEAMAPPGDLPALKVLTAHETAAIAFLELEADGRPDSAAPLRRYLDSSTA